MLLKETNIETFDFGRVPKKLWNDWNVVWLMSQHDPNTYVAFFLEKNGRFLFYDWTAGCCHGCDSFGDVTPWTDYVILSKKIENTSRMFENSKDALKYARQYVTDAVDSLCSYVLDTIADGLVPKDKNEMTKATKKSKPRLLVIDGKYQHYKTKTIYSVMGVATQTETQEKLVLYSSGDNATIWARPYEMFLDEVAPDVYRFELLKEQDNA